MSKRNQMGGAEKVAPELVLHYTGLLVGLCMSIPAIVKNAKNEKPSETSEPPLVALPLSSTAIIAVASFFRLPNQVFGLLTAMNEKKPQEVQRFALICASTFFAGLVFFATLWLMAVKLDERKYKDKKRIAQGISGVLTAFLVSIVVYLLYHACSRQLLRAPGGVWPFNNTPTAKSFSVLQLLSLPLIVAAFGPLFKKIHKDKSKVTEGLSVGTTALYVLDGLLRFPNVSRGLFQAVRMPPGPDRKQKLAQLSISLVGIFIVLSIFYSLVVCIAQYNTDCAKDTRKDKHAAEILQAVYAALIVCVIVYFAWGMTHPNFRR